MAEIARGANAQINVSNPERWFCVVAGVALAAYGLTRRSIGGTLLAGVGGALTWRGTTGRCPIYSSLGISTADEDGDREVSVAYGRGIPLEVSVTINAPPEDLYRFWRNFENLPRFMTHLKSVTVIDDKHSHWVAKGPAGTDAEWDAEVIHEVPNALIGWRSIDGGNIRNAGSVHFNPADGNSATEVKVVLRYDPPAGVLGAAVAKVFGRDPAHEVQEDLQALKDLIEAG